MRNETESGGKPHSPSDRVGFFWARLRQKILKVSFSILWFVVRVTWAHGERVKLEAPLWSSGCEWGGIALSVAIMNRGVCRPDPALTRAIPCA